MERRHFSIITERISSSVSCIPSRAITPTPAIVDSASSFTIPSPSAKRSFSQDSESAMMAASTALAILAAQEGDGYIPIMLSGNGLFTGYFEQTV